MVGEFFLDFADVIEDLPEVWPVHGIAVQALFDELFEDLAFAVRGEWKLVEVVPADLLDHRVERHVLVREFLVHKLPGQTGLPQEDAEGVHVGAGAELVTSEHLWREPMRRNLVVVLLFHFFEPVALLSQPVKAEVTDLDVPIFVDQDVRRVQVPVDDVDTVQVGHALCHGVEDIQDLIHVMHADLLLHMQQLIHRTKLHVFSNMIEVLLVDGDAHEHDDVRMVQAMQDSRFFHEPRCFLLLLSSELADGDWLRVVNFADKSFEVVFRGGNFAFDFVLEGHLVEVDEVGGSGLFVFGVGLAGAVTLAGLRHDEATESLESVCRAMTLSGTSLSTRFALVLESSITALSSSDLPSRL